VYSDDDEWWVDRAHYSVPGMLLYFRDASYAYDYTLGDSWYDPPSYGPKHGLLVVDSHSFPYMWDDATYTSGQNVRLSDRVQTADATFTLQDTTPFTINRFDYALDQVVETKTFGPRPAVNQFHDSIGYYPGLWYRPATGGLYFWNVAASAVIPAQANYTTRITWPDNSPLYELYGYDMGDTILGSGNPGDDGVQFGLHMAVVDKAADGSWGLIRLWNKPGLLELQKMADKTLVKPGEAIKYFLRVVNTSPVAQKFAVHDPLPENVTILNGGPFYDAATNSIHWEYWVPANSSRAIFFSVKVNKGVPAGTVIVNEAAMTDGALGGTASVSTTVR
jgi:uncharacterized repeat protein (TIGR01451 family)